MAPRNRFLFYTVFVCAVLVFFGFWLERQYTVPVLMYHNIGVNPENRNDTVSPENFARQLRFIKSHGYHVLRLSELVAGLKSGRRFSRRSVVLTFDDGRENNFTQAFPILKAHGVPAIFFISGDYVGNPDYMTWDQIRILSAAGMDVGSHGMDEQYLPSLSEDRQRYEIFNSKKRIEAELNIPVDFYCYSIGGFSEQIKNFVRQAGYQAALATNRGTHPEGKDIFEIRRVKMTDKDKSSLILAVKLSGFYNVFRSPKKPY